MAHLRLFGPAREAAGVARADIAGSYRRAGADRGRVPLRRRVHRAWLATSRIWVNGESATACASRWPTTTRWPSSRRCRADDGGRTVWPEGGRLTHVDEHGKAHMVDVTGKVPTLRIAEARCSVRTTADVSAVLADPAVGSDLLEAARFSGILAAKTDVVPRPPLPPDPPRRRGRRRPSGCGRFSDHRRGHHHRPHRGGDGGPHRLHGRRPGVAPAVCSTSIRSPPSKSSPCGARPVAAQARGSAPRTARCGQQDESSLPR